MKKLVIISLFSIALQFAAGASSIDSSMAMAGDTVRTMKKNHNSYLAVNATFFLKQFLSFASQNVSISSSPYIFDYRIVPRNSGFRISAGVGYNQTKTTIPASATGANFDEIDKDHVLNISYRLGYVYQKKIAKRWTVIVGADFIGTVMDSVQSVASGTDNTTNHGKGWTIGLGPSLGIQFDISKRMGLFTESAIYYTYGSSSFSDTFANFPEQNSNITTTSNSFNFIVPVSIFYYIRF